jgi:hypothetical protein
MLLSWPPLRRRLYEVFLRFHQTLALLVVVSSWLHVPSTRLPRFALYTCLGIFSLASLADGWLLVRRSVALTRRKDKDGPSVVEIFKHQGNDDKKPLQLTLLLKEHLKMKAGSILICGSHPSVSSPEYRAIRLSSLPGPASARVI